MKSKKITELTNTEVRNFFLKGESYFTGNLPKYFVFHTLLKDLFNRVEIKDDKTQNPCKFKPSHVEGVNHIIFGNKDGKYSWRPLQLIHPALYVAMVHEITSEDNWKCLKCRFEEFQGIDKIVCQSIPVQSEKDKQSDTAASIANWWTEVEQQSLELGLSFEYVMYTDIADCYGSIYTHSVPWAIYGKDNAKKVRNDKDLLGNKLDKLLRDMSYGQTNGIPQGSVLMDFIAEMVLGYIDLLLTEKLSAKSNSLSGDYKILRYRDDYRIFTNSPKDAEQITKCLTEELSGFGMHLNAGKTLLSSDIIIDSIKPDKRYWNSIKQSSKDLQNHLLLIHSLACKHPNSGSVVKALDKFYKRINSKEKKGNNNEPKEKEEIKGSIKVMASIVTDIALKNPRTYPLACGILSVLLHHISQDKADLLTCIKNKFKRTSNTGYMEIWLQRITLKSNRSMPYEEKLCKVVSGEGRLIWNSEWLCDDIRRMICCTKLIDESKIDEMPETIEREEIQCFEY